MAVLTLDLGNSTLDVARWSGADALGTPEREPLDRWRLPADEALFARLTAALARLESGGARAALSSVSSEGRTEGVAAVLRTLGWDVLSPPDSGLEVACRTPWTVGQDRLFAARAAFARAPAGAIVLDAGTALTVDAVVPGSAPARGVFRGGAIAPGPALLAGALAAGGARLPRVEPQPGARALGRDTLEALEAGVSVGFRGAARALLEGIEAELVGAAGAAPGELAVFVTGGARAFLLEPQPFVARELRVVSDLVHRGLLAAAVA